MALNPETLEYLRGIARELNACGHGGRAAIIKRATAHLRWSPSRLYSRLKKDCGWSSGRKTRADRGETKQDIKALETVAALQKACLRKNGKQTMHTPMAIAVAQNNGADISVSTGRLNALMRQRNFDVRSQRQAAPAIQMRATHPNHVHQVDPSLCLVYYLNNKQYIIRDDQLYKNKLDGLSKVQFKCWRYVLVDKASALLVVRYYVGAGESQENIADFLLYAWGKKPHAPYHGVPDMLYWDKGSANTAGMVRNMLDALDVRHETHAAGNARAKGAVEGGNNTVETKFECLLKTSPVSNVHELNDLVETWCVAYNGNLIPHYDSRLRRKGLTAPVARTDLWLLIRDDQLRALPDKDACRETLQGKPISRKVTNMRITYKHPRAEKTREYLLGDYDGISDKMDVIVAPMLYGDCRIVVRVQRYDGAEISFCVEPVPLNGYDQFGQPNDAVVMGEGYAALPDNAATLAAKQLDRRAYPNMTQKEIKKAKNKNAAPLPDINAMGVLEGITPPTYMPRRGTVLPLAAAGTVDIHQRISRVKAMLQISEKIGRPLTATENKAIKKDYPNGMTADYIESWVSAALTVTTLHVMQGGA